MVILQTFDANLPCDAIVHAAVIDLDGQITTLVEATEFRVGRVGPLDKGRELNLPRGSGGIDGRSVSTLNTTLSTTTTTCSSAPLLLGRDVLVGEFRRGGILGGAGDLPARAGPTLEEGGGSAPLRHPIEREGTDVDGLGGQGAVSARAVLDGYPGRIRRVEAGPGLHVVGTHGPLLLVGHHRVERERVLRFQLRSYRTGIFADAPSTTAICFIFCMRIFGSFL
mmetsp:Transcript_20278/g.58210  ORF Transcript_20278/g.58210 Transcript_20278/m.58210 type:complete len:224 (-) Transcript_20278:121-792(-)